MKNPEKRHAHSKVNYALRKGILIKSPCVKCGNENVQAHHSDYSQPLNVTWLCAKCHGLEHREEKNRDKDYRPKLIMKGGVKRNPNSTYFTLFEEVNNLRNKGVSYRDIAKILNISCSQAFKIYNNCSYG